MGNTTKALGLRCLGWLAALALAGCSSTGSGGKGRGGTLEEGWIKPSPVLRQQIADEATRLPWTRGFERLEQIRWFASVGEPGYEALLELAADPRTDVAASALAALGATLDKRLVEPIRAIEWDDEVTHADLDLERARTLLRLGDWSRIPVLIEGLGDERLYTRSLCLEALAEATRETHDYDPRAGVESRQLAIVRWESWWKSRALDPMLSAR